VPVTDLPIHLGTLQNATAASARETNPSRGEAVLTPVPVYLEGKSGAFIKCYKIEFECWIDLLGAKQFCGIIFGT